MISQPFSHFWEVYSALGHLLVQSCTCKVLQPGLIYRMGNLVMKLTLVMEFNQIDCKCVETYMLKKWSAGKYFLNSELNISFKSQ